MDSAAMDAKVVRLTPAQEQRMQAERQERKKHMLPAVTVLRMCEKIERMKKKLRQMTVDEMRADLLSHADILAFSKTNPFLFYSFTEGGIAKRRLRAYKEMIRAQIAQEQGKMTEKERDQQMGRICRSNSS